MPFGRSMLAMSLVTALITGMLMFIHPHEAAPVLRDMTPTQAAEKRLTNTNLVDWLLTLSLHAKLKRVDWSSTTLSLDLIIPDDETLDDEAVQTLMKDAEQIWQMSFLQLSNVNRVLLRIGEMPQSTATGMFERSLSQNRSGYRLLLAADVRRTDRWIGLGEEGWHGIENAETDSYWRNRLRMSFTPLWQSKRNAAFIDQQQ
ncbi:hypothetical protein H8B09_08515 [Paenibacillus sp. PR3]|uniref:Uncharacterized protein n=1 Tax=Paenibacillus terricola TaxID=2763503 RepID=A0ABR8MT17_9BACL|nr:hypothetical protein [Paenibacillus terricola]MBD3918790.1 hypothetical protein [Paenibacillus terricola]